jgi:xanthine/uracil permease
MPHVKTTHDALPKQSRVEKFGRVAEHICFALAGAFLFVFPPEAVRDSVWWWVIPILSAFLFFGGIPAAISSWRGKFKTEYVAVIFIGASVTMITLTLWVSAIVNSRETTLVFAAILSAFCFKLLSRFGTLNRYVKEQLGGDD